MPQIHQPEGCVHWKTIKIEAKLHYFVTIPEHKVNTQFLSGLYGNIPAFSKEKSLSIQNNQTVKDPGKSLNLKRK